MQVVHSTAAWLLAAALGLSGCASLTPQRFYQLQGSAAALPVTAARDGGPALLLGPLTLADYLERETLVQREADGSLSIDSGQRWAGSLKDDIAQLLLRQLAARLDTSRVAVYPDRVGLRPEAQVRLNIGRLDAGPLQPAVLEAQWRVLDGKGELRASRVVRLEEPHDGSVGDQVRAQSALLERLSAELAAAIAPLVRRSAQRPVAAPGAKDTAGAANVLLPALPAVVPVRRDSEVFRF